MTMPSRDLNLFGLDLGRALPALKEAAAVVFGGGWLSWLDPEVRVGLREGEGGAWQEWQHRGNRWQVRSSLPPSKSHRGVQFQALRVPDELFLTKHLPLPDLSPAALQSAIALEARSQSPFVSDDLLWAYRIDTNGSTGHLATLALASATQVRRYVAQAGCNAETTEVWGLPDGSAPVVFPGFGEIRRQRFVTRRRRYAACLLWLAVSLGGVIALTPTLKLRQQAIDAVRAHDAVVSRASPALQARERFLARAQRRDELANLRDSRLDATRLLDMLVRELADDTYLSRIQVDGRKVSIQGQSSNAAALMQKLSALPDISDVKAPGGATRGRESGTERFNIEFVMDAKAFALTPVQSVVSTQPATAEPGSSPAQAKEVSR